MRGRGCPSLRVGEGEEEGEEEGSGSTEEREELEHIDELMGRGGQGGGGKEKRRVTRRMEGGWRGTSVTHMPRDTQTVTHMPRALKPASLFTGDYVH